MKKTALITGASRGIGRAIAHRLAREGVDIIVAAKSINENPKLPGTIFSVAEEVKKYGVKGIPCRLNVRDPLEIKETIETLNKCTGSIDILINNAGALWWRPIKETDHKRYNLINDINSRASFLLAKECAPMMANKGWGHIIMHSPPLPNPNDIDIYKSKTAYMISKFGMTMASMGIAAEYYGDGIAGNTIWPSTPIESAAVENTRLGNPKMWRKPEIVADAIWEIINEDPKKFTGNQLIDEDYLKTKGVKDFTKYQCVIGHEPPKLMEVFNKIL
jgi:citronellol/citronellal dehydrogenase